MIISTRELYKVYQEVMATEDRLKARQEKREDQPLDSLVWVVHDKDTGQVISAASTRTMATKRAVEWLNFPETKARKHAWLNLEKYSLKEFKLS